MSIDAGTISVVIATFVGPIAAVVVSFIREGSKDRKDRRLHVFRSLMATRRYVISVEHVTALNLIEVEFHKCKSVLEAWRAYLRFLEVPTTVEDDPWLEKRDRHLAELLFEMGKVVGIKYDSLSIYRGGYIPKGWAYTQQAEYEKTELIKKLAAGTHDLRVQLTNVPNALPNNPVEDSSK